MEGKVNRKEPGIQALARKYNLLCKQLKQMIVAKKCPPGAIAPIPIDTEVLFQLDIDDDTWQDLGLTDENDNRIDLPPWLVNEHVRIGIKALLDFERCEEEERRIKYEREAMQDWFTEEWSVINQALAWSHDQPEVMYQLLERKEYLVRLCITWQPLVAKIPCKLSGSWGPTKEDINHAKKYEFEQQALNSFMDSDCDMDEDQSFEDSDVGEEVMEDEQEDADNAEFIDSIEITGMMENFRFSSS